jgi:hypothetical protein
VNNIGVLTSRATTSSALLRMMHGQGRRVPSEALLAVVDRRIKTPIIITKDRYTTPLSKDYNVISHDIGVLITCSPTPFALLRTIHGQGRRVSSEALLDVVDRVIRAPIVIMKGR